MTNPQPVQISTPTDTTIVLTRTFNAPRRLVWDAFFSPDKMRRWMLPPPGWILTLCEVNARVAGGLSLAWKSDEANPAMTLKGVFTEVVPHERAIHTETVVLGSGQTIGTQVERHEFVEKEGITTMRITQTFDSKETRDGTLPGMDQCMEPGYKQLDALLAESS